MGDLVGGELLSPGSCNYYVSTKIDIFPCLCIYSPGLLLELPVTGELGGEDDTTVFILSVEKTVSQRDFVCESNEIVMCQYDPHV